MRKKKKQAFEAEVTEIEGVQFVRIINEKKQKPPSYADFRCPNCGADLTEDELGAFCLHCDWPDNEEE
jgi:hypothetical protein